MDLRVPVLGHPPYSHTFSKRAAPFVRFRKFLDEAQPRATRFVLLIKQRETKAKTEGKGCKSWGEEREKVSFDRRERTTRLKVEELEAAGRHTGSKGE